MNFRPRTPAVLMGGALLLLVVAASSASSPGHGTQTQDLGVLEELERGRYWHASRLLAADSGSAPFLRARAEAGWGNWPAVWRLLERMDAVSPLDRPIGWILRGRAAEAVGRPTEAAVSYRRALGEAGGLPDDTALVARIRLARVSSDVGARNRAIEILDDLRRDTPWAASWLGVELARAAADEGDVVGARTALTAVQDPDARRRAWSLLPRAHLAGGDTASALDAYLGAVRSAPDDGVRGEAWARIGELRLARGETSTARHALSNSVELTSDRDAALLLLRLGLDDAGESLRVYRILRRGGEPEEALRALEAYERLRVEDGPLPGDLRLERARLLYRLGRLADAAAVLEELSAGDGIDVAAPALDLLSTIRRRQGLFGEAGAFRDMLVRRFPSHPDAVDVIFFRGDDSHDRQAWDAALSAYGRTVEMSPASNRAGLARMRMGQIHLTRGDQREAARVFEGYLGAFPDGRRWDEASYWAAWTRRALGEEEAARTHARRILDRDPLSYYAVLALRLFDEGFSPDLPEGTAPSAVPAIQEALDRIELLQSAGLDEGVGPTVEALARRYDDSEERLLRLSVELSERGFSMDGISLGWEVQSRGRPWDQWLARAVYPFPYRELVRLEAEEWGLDPFYLAALIRQESAFLAEARSSAGALGLMQVIPSTGESLARRVGPDRFTEELLLRPEVNLHLGAAFLSRLHDRFGDRLPLVLAAYNAGPTRADRWEARFPERADLDRFTERIPFEETRGYVKAVTRNTEVYRWLYGRSE